jgi:hypothetical protein
MLLEGAAAGATVEATAAQALAIVVASVVYILLPVACPRRQQK